MFAGIRTVHFIGIGGTAMASAAAAMRQKGYSVTGSDQNVYPADVHIFGGAEDSLTCPDTPSKNLAHKPDLVVVGNAVSRGNPEAEFVLERKLRYCSLPELLKEFFIRGKRSRGGRGNARQDHDDVATDLGF